MTTKYEKKSGYLYILKFPKATKFGITTRLEGRMNEYRAGYPKEKFEIIKAQYFTNYSHARMIEKLLVRLLKHYKVPEQQEWVDHRVTISDSISCYHTSFKLMTSAFAACNAEEFLVCIQMENLIFHLIFYLIHPIEIFTPCFRYSHNPLITPSSSASGKALKYSSILAIVCSIDFH